jgi:hypothetical protein
VHHSRACLCGAGGLAEAHQDVLKAADIPQDIKSHSEQLRARYLADALGSMMHAECEYRRSSKKVEDVDKDLSKLPAESLLSVGTNRRVSPCI